MTLLVVATVIYLPLVLPLLLPGVSVNAGQIALSLILEISFPSASDSSSKRATRMPRRRCCIR